MHWPMFEQVWRQEQALHDMLLALGIPPVDAARQFGGQAYLAMQENCLHCPNSGVCRAWLDGDRETPGPEVFCGNYASFLASMAA